MDTISPPPLTAVAAVTGRRSVRRFLPDPVPRETVEAILDAAARAPSGTNSQPWQVRIVTGAARERLAKAVTAAARAGEISQEYRYAPEVRFEPFLTRRRKVGYDLYALLGIARDDYAARTAQHLRNFELFGAPVGLFYSMDRRLEYGSWLDMGMFMQNVMIVARAYGLETCPQASWLRHGAVVHRELAIPEGEILISGMALGYADRTAAVNSLETERAPASAFSVFLDD